MSPASLPPYSIAAPAFRFRALAALSGRAPLGGPRELALACVIGARLAVVLVRDLPMLDDAARASRAAAARAWLASAALPAAARVPVARWYDATARPLAVTPPPAPRVPASRAARAAGSARARPAPPVAAVTPRAEVRAAVADAIAGVVEAAGSHLDGASRQELLRLAGELAAAAKGSEA